ncbi:unnamed protein product, partial [Ectocarpus sp. 8 AP-2014]
SGTHKKQRLTTRTTTPLHLEGAPFALLPSFLPLRVTASNRCNARFGKTKNKRHLLLFSARRRARKSCLRLHAVRVTTTLRACGTKEDHCNKGANVLCFDIQHGSKPSPLRPTTKSAAFLKQPNTHCTRIRHGTTHSHITLARDGFDYPSPRPSTPAALYVDGNLTG